MNVKDLYFDVLCENEDKDIIDKIVFAIKKGQKLAKEYGATVICKIYNCKEGWLNI